jgi:hypothetical protein
MTKKVIIPDEIYEEIGSLGAFNKQKVDDVIVSILKAVKNNSYSIIELAKAYKVPITLENVIGNILEAGVCSTNQLYNKVLEHFGVKGLYWFEDSNINEIDLDEFKIRVVYEPYVEGPDFRVDRLDFESVGGVKKLATWSYIDKEKVTKEALSKLERLVKHVDPFDEFGDVIDEIAIMVIDEDDICFLQIDFEAETLNSFPSVAKISDFVKKLFAKADIR